jgi:hypothetical protein
MPRAHMIVEVDEAELICRMVEAYAEVHRPEGLTPEEAVDAMPPDPRADWMRVAHAVRDYWGECYSNARPIH